MGWLIVMFDLPTDTKAERGLAAKFRNNLLDDGYLMLQYSVYVRSAVTLDKREKYVSSLKRMNPETGSVKCLFITDTQWGQIETFAGKRSNVLRSVDKQPNIYEQLQFW